MPQPQRGQIWTRLAKILPPHTIQRLCCQGGANASYVDSLRLHHVKAFPEIHIFLPVMTRRYRQDMPHGRMVWNSCTDALFWEVCVAFAIDKSPQVHCQETAWTKAANSSDWVRMRSRLKMLKISGCFVKFLAHGDITSKYIHQASLFIKRNMACIYK